MAVVSIVATLAGTTALSGGGTDGAGVTFAVASIGVARAGAGEATTTLTTVLELPDLESTTTLADPTPTEIVEIRELQAEEDLWIGGLVPLSLGGPGPDVPAPTAPVDDREGCVRQAKTAPLKTDGQWDRNLVAQMTHGVFDCLASVAGLGEVAPTALRRWNGAARWGFGSLADQVAAEAVVVAYCESEGMSSRALTGSNAFGYAGLFQMGATEMGRFGERGGSRYDPVDNAVAAANYFLYQYWNRAGWGGWSPWAVVNTNFNDEVNDQVRVPVLPRFVSSDPEFSGRPGPELPAWAVDPWSWRVPHWSGTGCPYTGGRWPTPAPLAEG